MIVLDTNVLSELLKPHPEPAVIDWMRAVAHREPRTTSITRAELLFEARILPERKRRRTLETAIDSLLTDLFPSGVLPFDDRAADTFADIAASRRAAGRPIGDLDAQIASIARATNATVATRNAPDFELCGIDLDDPWLHPEDA